MAALRAGTRYSSLEVWPKKSVINTAMRLALENSGVASQAGVPHREIGGSLHEFLRIKNFYFTHWRDAQTRSSRSADTSGIPRASFY